MFVDGLSLCFYNPNLKLTHMNNMIFKPNFSRQRLNESKRTPAIPPKSSLRFFACICVSIVRNERRRVRGGKE